MYLDRNKLLALFEEEVRLEALAMRRARRRGMLVWATLVGVCAASWLAVLALSVALLRGFL